MFKRLGEYSFFPEFIFPQYIFKKINQELLSLSLFPACPPRQFSFVKYRGPPKKFDRCTRYDNQIKKFHI